MTGKRIKKEVKVQKLSVPTAPKNFTKSCEFCGKSRKYATSEDAEKRKKQLEKKSYTCRKCRKHSSIKKRRIIALDKMEQRPSNVHSLSPSDLAKKQGVVITR